AARIPLKPVSKKCRMDIMLKNRKFKELTDEFKAEDIESWPGEENTVGEGFYYRGVTYLQLKDGPAAAKDLRKAVDYLTDDYSRGEAWMRLGEVCLNKLKDDNRALAAYRQALKAASAGGWIKNNSVITAAGILRKQGKYDEALRMLDNLDINMKGYWGIALLSAHARTFAAQGKKAEAIATFKKALGVKGINEAQKNAVQKSLKALETGVK
ncbi:tetratricopeptide repeat protein, partial [Verrucomicrobiota bacterium]